MNVSVHTDEAADWIERIEWVLNSVRPALILDKGNVKLVKVVGKDIYLEFLGACRQCPSLKMTLNFGIAPDLRSNIPEINQIIMIDLLNNIVYSNRKK